MIANSSLDVTMNAADSRADTRSKSGSNSLILRRNGPAVACRSDHSNGRSFESRNSNSWEINVERRVAPFREAVDLGSLADV